MFGISKITLLLLSLINFTQSQKCGPNIFTSDNGVISSPNYPSKYPSLMYCRYEIKAPFNHRIRLSWDHLAIWDEMPNCFSSSVLIRVGCGINRRFLTRFCNKYESFQPHDIYSKDNCMRIEFRSSSDSYNVPIRFNGFKARYKFVPMNNGIDSADLKCSQSYITTLTNDYGLLATPNWPLNSNIGSCKWRIKVPCSYNVKFNFMDIGLYNPGPITNNCYYPDSNYLQINYTSIRNWYHHEEKRYCGSSQPYSISFSQLSIEKQYDYVNVTLVQNSPRVTDKLLLGYVVYKTSEDYIWSPSPDPETKDKSSSFKFPYGYISIPIFAFILVFYFVKRSIQRQRILNARNNNRNFNTLPVATITNQHNASQMTGSRVAGTTTTIDAPAYTPKHTDSSYPPTSTPGYPSTDLPPYAPPSYQDVLNDASQAPSMQIGVHPLISNTVGDSFQTAPPTYESSVNRQGLPPVDVVNTVDINVTNG